MSVVEGIEAFQEPPYAELRLQGPDPTFISSIVQNQLFRIMALWNISLNPSHELLAVQVLEATVTLMKNNCKGLGS